MDELSDYLLRSVCIGIGATAFMDVWGVLQKRLLGIPSLDYRLLGRWIGHFRHRKFAHGAIARSAPITHEAVLDWSAHYLIGIAFAGLLLVIWGLEWARQPTLLPALAIGVGTVVAPFFLMQPGMGAGIAASKTPRPNVARLRSLIAHSAFGVGLYCAGLACAALLPSGPFD